MQQGDVLLFQTSDGGDINVEGGLVEMSGGLETAAYLSLFGGNEDDDGRASNLASWWGNLSETDPDLRYRSETQNLLQALPATPNNLIRVESAAKRDLQVFLNKKIASSVEVTASIPRLYTLQLVVTIVAEGVESTFNFVENWKQSE